MCLARWPRSATRDHCGETFRGALATDRGNDCGGQTMPGSTVLERGHDGASVPAAGPRTELSAASALDAGTAKRVVVVLSGAGTRSRGRYPTVALPTDYLHRQVTERLYRAIGGDELLHPPWFGLAPPDWTYSWIRPVLQRKLAKYPGRRFLFVGHSLGGYLGALFAHGHTDLDITTVAIGSPFGAVTGMPGTGRVFAQGTEDLRQHRRALGDRAPSLILVASEADRLVRASSALPVMPGAKRVLLTTDRRTAESDPERVIVARAPGHVALVNHPEVLARIADITAPSSGEPGSGHRPERLQAGRTTKSSL